MLLFNANTILSSPRAKVKNPIIRETVKLGFQLSHCVYFVWMHKSHDTTQYTFAFSSEFHLFTYFCVTKKMMFRSCFFNFPSSISPHAAKYQKNALNITICYCVFSYVEKWRRDTLIIRWMIILWNIHFNLLLFSFFSCFYIGMDKRPLRYAHRVYIAHPPPM